MRIISALFFALLAVPVLAQETNPVNTAFNDGIS